MKTCTYFKSGIGNFIMATPALQALADMDDRGKTDICFDYHWAYDTRIPSVVNMIEHMPFINALVRHPGECNIDDYDVWNITCQSELSKTSVEIKSRLKGNFLWLQTIDWLNTEMHEIDVNFRNVQNLGYEGEQKPLYMPVGEGPMLEGERPYIGLCNSAYDAPMWQKKHWPHFAELAETIKSFFGGTLFGIGGGGDLKEVDLDIDFSGQLEMVETAKALSQMDLFITTDTGCMHAADALDVPLVAIFGPTMTKKNRPRGPRSYIMASTMPCAPCYMKDMFYECEYGGCMAMIRPEHVMSKAREVMRRHYGA